MGRVAACVLLTVLVLVAAGCGGSSSGSASGQATTTTGTSTSTGARAAGFQALAACLKQHGVTPPSGGRRPGAGSGGLANLTKAQQQALSACRSTLPGGGAGRGRLGGGGQSQNPAFAKYTSCLKSHGVTFGKQSSGTAFQKAQTACAKYRPTAGAGS
jgi:hypothetical protein